MSLNNHGLKLLQVLLPEYGHKSDKDLTKFLLNFENIVSKYSLTSFDIHLTAAKTIKIHPSLE